MTNDKENSGIGKKLDTGLILPPDLIKLFSDRIPDFEKEYWDVIKSVMDQSIKESNHQHEMEKIEKESKSRRISILEIEAQSAIKLKSRGLIFGFVLAGGLVIGAIVTGAVGATGVAVALVGASAVGMVSGFLKAGQKEPGSVKSITDQSPRKRIKGPQDPHEPTTADAVEKEQADPNA